MAAQETVILVHGLWVHGVLMTFMRRRIARCGHRAICYSYPSVRFTLAENADRLASFSRNLGAGRLHFVGHSLGGLVVLTMLARIRDLDVGRIVLVGTPFVDSIAAHHLARLPGGRAVLGRSMREWLQGGRPSAFDRYDIGVIAGSFGIGLGRLVVPGLPRPHDGVVSVVETRVPEARDHIVLKVSHSAMLVSSAVAYQICEFISHGVFSRQPPRQQARARTNA